MLGDACGRRAPGAISACWRSKENAFVFHFLFLFTFSDLFLPVKGGGHFFPWSVVARASGGQRRRRKPLKEEIRINARMHSNAMGRRPRVGGERRGTLGPTRRPDAAAPTDSDAID